MSPESMRGRAVWRWLTIAGLASTGLVQAQTAPVQLPPSLDPGAIQRQSIEQQKRLLEEERQRSRSDPRASPLDRSAVDRKDGAAATSAARVVVKRIEFSPSKILSDAELKKISADYEGKEVGFADLQALVARVNALYKARGAIAAEAVIPAQDVSGGVIMIRLIEGKIGSYNLRDNDSTAASYVLDRMHDAPGALVDIARLERDLIWFNRTNDVQLKAVLKPGQAFATTDIDLTLREPSRHSVSLFTDTAGSRSTGEYRAGAVYSNRSLFGYRDELTISTTHARGYDGQALAYSVPINTWGGRFSFGYNDDRTRIKYGPFSPLNVSGKAESWNASLRQPVWVDQRTLIAANLGVVDRRSLTFIQSVRLQKVETVDFNLGVDALRSDDSGAWSGSFNVTTGDAHSPEHLGYTVLRGNVERDQDLGRGFEGRVNLGWQATSSDRLPSSAQYFLGGAGTVRAYSNSYYSGLEGYVLNLELRRALDLRTLAPGSLTPDLTLLGFLDRGQTRPKGPGLSNINLQSIGAGFEMRVSQRFFARLTVGHQMFHRAEEPRSVRVDASVVLALF
jgi:hemolysin activation/secretion protein